MSCWQRRKNMQDIESWKQMKPSNPTNIAPTTSINVFKSLQVCYIKTLVQSKN
jgi:hypothetical protein